MGTQIFPPVLFESGKLTSRIQKTIELQAVLEGNANWHGGTKCQWIFAILGLVWSSHQTRSAATIDLLDMRQADR